MSFVLIGNGLYFLYQDAKRTKFGSYAIGRVIRTKGKWSFTGNRHSYAFFPVVEFKTKEGEVLQMDYPVGAGVPMHREGQTLDFIYYDGELYPTGPEWKFFYWFLIGLGLVVGLYVTYLLTTGEASFFANL
ncbi:hypothetical protein GU926_13185 [Nibribacter ruber]|uniref:DUF3592 domain-containing protein n=1 Tax=Nibribacter ruber TaxID=2698458 RepID=A0A6P1P0E3_9BACT|nr:hypothetical protein [Nibribacter ruber]QHL88334.1 hypothetical protein GU926_13185 [Nibribacter ruber]